jgi:hypothetical protein
MGIRDVSGFGAKTPTFAVQIVALTTTTSFLPSTLPLRCVLWCHIFDHCPLLKKQSKPTRSCCVSLITNLFKRPAGVLRKLSTPHDATPTSNSSVITTVKDAQICSAPLLTFNLRSRNHEW